MIKHRGETRGLGGIFFDDLNDKDANTIMNFSEEAVNSVVAAYCPLVSAHKDDAFTPEQKEWQQARGVRARAGLPSSRPPCAARSALYPFHSLLTPLPPPGTFPNPNKPHDTDAPRPLRGVQPRV